MCPIDRAIDTPEFEFLTLLGGAALVAMVQLKLLNLNGYVVLANHSGWKSCVGRSTDTAGLRIRATAGHVPPSMALRRPSPWSLSQW